MKFPLLGTRCYLSAPIEYDDGSWSRKETKDFLTDKFGINVFDPYADPKQQWVPALHEARQAKDYATMISIARKFVRKDLQKVGRSDFLIACLPHKIPTAGTHHEIILSNTNKNPTLIVCPQGREKIPVWYWGFIQQEGMFGSWNDLYQYLSEIEAGEHMDNDRWDFIRGLL